MNDPVQKLLQFLVNSTKTLVFTGAGISTESGISDFRSKGGVWDRFQPVYFQDFLSSKERRKEYWRMRKELYPELLNARPNPGHDAIVELEKMGKLLGIITQNIDELHQEAGNSKEKVLELHGTNKKTVCLQCGDITRAEESFERLKAGEEALCCLKCSGILKPATISFGQSLDPIVLEAAERWSRGCDLCLALGSTLVVEPAASLPRIAKQAGAVLVIINLSPTPLDRLADLAISASIGKTLQQTIEKLKREVPKKT